MDKETERRALLPCPFCGSPGEPTITWDEIPAGHCSNGECPAHDVSFRNWNGRASGQQGVEAALTDPKADFVKLETNEPMLPCSTCGHPAELWELHSPVNGAAIKSAMCSNSGEEDDGHEVFDACPFYLPPTSFYAATKREAVAFWNRRHGYYLQKRNSILTFCLAEAANLVAVFGGENSSVCVQEMSERMSDEEEVMSAGKYAWFEEYSDEGVIYLGPHDPDSEIAAQPSDSVQNEKL